LNRIPSKRVLERAGRAATHLFLIGLGVVAVAWAISVLPTFLRDTPINQVAGRIVEGEIYREPVLLSLIPVLEKIERDPLCRPVSQRSATIVRLRLLESAIALGDRMSIDDRLEQLLKSTRISLRCSPADSFLWLILYWADGSRNGFDARHIGYLRLSYELGPNEGWVAVKRNRYAFAIFEQLPADLANQALDEFVGLVRSGFYRDASEILVGPGWRLRDMLLPRLANIEERHRQNFNWEVSQRGYRPGETPANLRPEARPWRD
jgi:hypothetical protein